MRGGIAEKYARNGPKRCRSCRTGGNGFPPPPGFAAIAASASSFFFCRRFAFFFWFLVIFCPLCPAGLGPDSGAATGFARILPALEASDSCSSGVRAKRIFSGLMSVWMILHLLWSDSSPWQTGIGHSMRSPAVVSIQSPSSKYGH